MNDDLGDRMKKQYENRTRYLLPRRTFTIIRLDGKAFHTFTRQCERPFDEFLMACMDKAAKVLCEQIQGAKLAFVQSDEISLLLTDFEKIKTDAWFDGNVQKMASVAASICTAAFNAAWQRPMTQPLISRYEDFALFDSRVFTIPDIIEVANYFVWRQKDATRNSISMAAQCYFSHNALHGKSSNDMQEMLFQQENVNWNNYPVGFKRGRAVVRRLKVGPVSYTDKRSGQTITIPDVKRHVWEIEDPPVFHESSAFLMDILQGVSDE